MRRADAIDAIVGDNIRVQRLARKMSQSALAQKLGLSFQQLQKYEKGTNRISAGRLWKIAQHFGVPILALYDGAHGRVANEPTLTKLITNRDAVRLVQGFDKINNKQLRKAIVMMVEQSAG
jgi:transcriptional regulator with XRE-family HTH domain